MPSMRQQIKVSCFFSSKKNCFLASPGFPLQRCFAFLLLCFGLAACGKIGDPSPPGPPDQIIYPKIYPTK